MAGPQFRSSSDSGGFSFRPSTSHTIPVPAGAQSGDVVIIAVHHDNYNLATGTIAGFTELSNVQASSSGGCRLRIFWKRLTAADTGNYTFSTGGDVNDGHQSWAVCYTRVVASGSPFDGTASTATRTTSGSTTPSVSKTTTGPGRRAVHIAITGGHGESAVNTTTEPPDITYTPQAGWTARHNNKPALIADIELLDAGSTGSVSAAQAPSTQGAAWLGALIGLDRTMTVGSGAPTGFSAPAPTLLRGTVPLFPLAISGPAAPPGATVRGRNTVTVGSIASPATVPAPAVTPGAVVLSPPSISAPSAPPTPSVRLRVVTPSIGSAEQVPQPAALSGDLTVPSIGTGQAFGTATLLPGAATVTATSTSSAAAFGTASVRLSIAPQSLAAATAFGAATLIAGAATIATTSAASVASVPPPWLQTQVVRTDPVTTGEQFGAIKVLLRLVVDDGIPADATIQSNPEIHLGAAVILPASVGSRETVPETVHLSLSIDPTARVPVAATGVAGVRYEALLMARVQQQSGPPTLLVVDPIDWLSIKWSNILNQPQELEVTCLLGGLTDPVLQRLRYPDRQPCELHVLRDGAQVFAGPVVGGQKSGEKLTLVARGLLAYLRFMVITDKLWLPSSTDQNLLVRSMIDLCQNKTYGHFGIDTSDVTNSGVYREGFWPEDELHNVADRVEELSESSDGLDVEVDPATRKLQLWTPAKGVDRSAGDDAVVFDARNIVDDDVLFSATPGDVASFAVGTGRTATGEETLYAQATNQELLATYGRACVTDSWPDAHDQATLQAHVNKLLDDRDQALWVPGPSIRVDPDSTPTRYDVGDHVWFEGGGRLGISGKFRVRQRTIDVDDAGRETGSLEFV